MASKADGLRQRSTNGHANGNGTVVAPTDEGKKTDERLDKHLECVNVLYPPAECNIEDWPTGMSLVDHGVSLPL